MGAPFDDSTRLGRDLHAVRWERTPLGAPDSWPRSLTTVVRLVIASRFSMWMAWGPELTFFCNDAYRRDTLGVKYPWALGRPAREVWAEIWDDIGPRIESVLAGGGATWDESLLLFLERSGYVEETYHTFSYSPLVDDRSAIAGMLCVVSEDTDRVIAERRMETLRGLGGALAVANTEAEVHAAASRQLADNQRDLPFTLLYLFDDDRTTARRAGSTGMTGRHPAAPPIIRTTDRDAAWPVADLVEGRVLVLDDLERRFPTLPHGAWDESPTHALAVPLAGGQDPRHPYGFLLTGLNRYRPLDAAYRGFVDLVAGQLSAALDRARAYEAEQARVEQLAELDRAKTAFFTNVSHELRTPLTLLLGPAEDALRDEADPLPPTQRGRVEIVQRNGERLLKLVNTLLDFSRIESGRTVARYEPLDLARYTADLAAMFESAIKRAGLAYTIDCVAADERVYVDREMWAKIVLNLLSNALKATFQGAITVRFGPSEDAVELIVSDTGVGIAAAEQPLLFQRFSRVLGARSRSHEGTGIGLALVAELVALHGGSVDVDSAVGEGSSFTVRVPTGTAHLPADQLAEAPPDAPDAGRYSAGYLAEAIRWLDEADDLPAEEPADDAMSRPRVLVVDDNADMRDYVTGLLADSYAVRSAPDGKAALDLARADPPDLVLTDVMMPNLDGFGLLAALRADPATMHIPVVMLSARAGDEATAEGLEAGASDYLVKPFTARELVARVHANLELDRVRRLATELARSKELLDQAEQHAHVGSWQVDLATGAVTGSQEYFRLLGAGADRVRTGGLAAAYDLVHPDDVETARAAITASLEQHVPLDIELRINPPDGPTRVLHALAAVEDGADGRPAVLRGSAQDVTDRRHTEQVLATAAVEHRIAEALQRSLMPPREFRINHIDVAAYYQPGVGGTQVGGDWYDVIEVGAGRTALVIGDVMGRGVRAAAVMGQLRTAVRAYARLDLRPGEVLRLLDATVGDLGADTIVTCVYAVYDPVTGELTYANAGHLPLLLTGPEGVQRLSALGPPLGTGYRGAQQSVPFRSGSSLALYTDGLVERRRVDIDTGIERLAAQLTTRAGPLDRLPDVLVAALLPEGPDDDVALLIAAVRDDQPPPRSATRPMSADETSVAAAREFTATTLREWAVAEQVAEDAVLAVSELVTNAVVHGRPPVELRLHRTAEHVRIEVLDGSAVTPRELDATPEDEHGRGLRIVAALAEQWGSRRTDDGKSVWCCVPLAGG
ncbi:MAG TPA: SpoIIE family protein phosphatase [Jatrophihabitans sp.]|nr:SpoIIE family protein phosphatase [Jatrophihabitans sp.]